MLKVAKRFTLVWDILLIPIILFFAVSFWEPLFAIFDIPVLGGLFEILVAVFLLLQTLYLPQIISLGLGIWYAFIAIKDRDLYTRKEIVFCVLLVLWCIMGAIMSFLLAYGIGAGEQGVPLP